MMTSAAAARIKVFCVDDNPLVPDAVKLQLTLADDMQWGGSAPDADSLLVEAERECSTIVLLDIDMPGRDPFSAVADLAAICPESRVVMYSGLLRRELVDRAIDAGAWGYVAKADSGELLPAIRQVASGSIAFSRSVLSLIDER
jgi:two-component system response regulator DesR